MTDCIVGRQVRVTIDDDCGAVVVLDTARPDKTAEHVFDRLSLWDDRAAWDDGKQLFLAPRVVVSVSCDGTLPDYTPIAPCLDETATAFGCDEPVTVLSAERTDTTSVSVFDRLAEWNDALAWDDSKQVFLSARVSVEVSCPAPGNLTPFVFASSDGVLFATADGVVFGFRG